MAYYYYAGASLPLLKPDEKPVLTEKEFISILESSVNKSHLHQILSLNVNKEINIDDLTNLGKKYWLREKNIRNELVKLRAHSLGIDGSEFLVDDENDPFIINGANAALKAQSPLEAELILDDLRWNWIEELESGHFFDQDFLTAYYVKLQILLRKEKFEVEQGKKNFQDVYNNILNTKDENKTGVTQ